MTAFVTADPNLMWPTATPLQVYQYAGNPGDDYVITRTSSGDCADTAFLFVPPAG